MGARDHRPEKEVRISFHRRRNPENPQKGKNQCMKGKGVPPARRMKKKGLSMPASGRKKKPFISGRNKGKKGNYGGGGERKKSVTERENVLSRARKRVLVLLKKNE